jgi:tRNA threonylcarbamoyladenosine biosynthesis protein TsaE
MFVPAALERRFTSPDPATTRELAARLAAAARPGDLICLRGELGAGKTQFAKGFGAGLGVTDVINSPSYILMAEYAGRLPLFHIDLYRLADASEALAGGLLDDRQSGGVTLVEWPERMSELLPAARLDVAIEGSLDGADGADGASGEARTITIRALDPALARYLEAAA